MDAGIRSLLDNEGNFKTSLSQRSKKSVSVDRKVELLVREFQRYRISIAGVSETKWFGNDIYSVDGFTVLHSGRAEPGRGQPVERGECVAIILDKVAAKAWSDGGSEWKPISSRVIKVRLRIAGRWARKNTKKSESVAFKHLTVICAYAPTYHSAEEQKESFFSELQEAIDSTSENDVLIIAGDFNARVGSRTKGSSEWMGVLGCHGIGKVNDQGMAFLQFCMINSLTIMNTWFEKRAYQKQTWQHPGTKAWHCIDYVLMRQNQRKLCNDTQVMRGADCWTDHKLIRSKLQLQLCRKPKAYTCSGRVKYAVEKLSDPKVKESFQEKVKLWLDTRWKDAQDKWIVMRDGIIDSAEVVLGKSKKYKSDWFRESAVKLDPLIEEKYKSFKSLLYTRSSENI